MNSNGIYNTAHGIEKHGFRATGTVYYNLTEAHLYEEALARREAQLSAHGALVAKTGIHTGRSAKDKHVVRDGKVDEKIWWDNNRPMEPEAFDRLYEDFMTQAQGMDLFVSDLAGGADEAHKLPVRVITENAWHALFIRNLLIRPERDELAGFRAGNDDHRPAVLRGRSGAPWLPLGHGDRCRPDPHDRADRRHVLCRRNEEIGLHRLNYILPEKGVMPMHCSANEGPDGDVAVFFGLSGTGKTTLSADPERTLIGDDEHGWSENGVFNFEGGCYAKTIRLSREAEPEIYSTTERFGTVLENVVLDDDRMPDFDDGSLTENTRAPIRCTSFRMPATPARAASRRTSSC
jgi:phosphoenolpyruvate carboxykinase (ATP)